MVCAVLALGPACARTQKLVINTNIPGAQISLIKRGEIRTRGNVVGVIKMKLSEPYEDPPQVIGTGPMVYEFPVVEDYGGFGVVGVASANQKRICQQVEIRAFNGSQYATQTIPVTGDVAQIYLMAGPQAFPPPPPGQPAPGVHGATPVQPPGS